MESFETLYETKQHLIYGTLHYLKIYRNKDDYISPDKFFTSEKLKTLL